VFSLKWGLIYLDELLLQRFKCKDSLIVLSLHDRLTKAIVRQCLCKGVEVTTEDTLYNRPSYFKDYISD
jgi:hypothetical protein